MLTFQFTPRLVASVRCAHSLWSVVVAHSDVNLRVWLSTLLFRLWHHFLEPPGSLNLAMKVPLGTTSILDVQLCLLIVFS